MKVGWELSCVHSVGTDAGGMGMVSAVGVGGWVGGER